MDGLTGGSRGNNWNCWNIRQKEEMLIFAGGVDAPGMAKGHKALEKVYEMRRKV